MCAVAICQEQSQSRSSRMKPHQIGRKLALICFAFFFFFQHVTCFKVNWETRVDMRISESNLVGIVRFFASCAVSIRIRARPSSTILRTDWNEATVAVDSNCFACRMLHFIGGCIMTLRLLLCGFFFGRTTRPCLVDHRRRFSRTQLLNPCHVTRNDLLFDKAMVKHAHTYSSLLMAD